MRRLSSAAVNVRTRRRQRLATTVDQQETLYVVKSGVLVLDAVLAAKKRQVVSILYPGDVFVSSCAPPLPETSLLALTASEALRLRWAAFEEHAAADPSLMAMLMRQMAEQQARQGLHVTMIGALAGEERVVTFLLELAVRFGRFGGQGVAFEVPLSRADIADYLALNPDTLSRIMSRLRAKGVISLPGRGRAIANDWSALSAMSPLADCVSASHGARGV